jgi:RND family efflux transporter MFP subunit
MATKILSISKITPVLIAAVLAGLVAWKLVENKRTIDRNAELSSTVNTVIPVTVEKPRYSSIDRRFSVNGRIVPNNEVMLCSKTTAVVLEKRRKAGDAVRRGTVIAQLENSVIRENLRAAEMDCVKAHKDVERFERLAAAGAVTMRELEDVQIVLRNAESRITELQDQLSNTTIVAPADGIIDRDFFEEGTLLSAGSQVAALVDDRSLKMELSVTEKELLCLKKGDRGVVTTDVYPGKTFMGTVAVIAPKGNNLYSYPVELSLDNVVGTKNFSPLHPGMYATAVFGANANPQPSVVISRKAIVGSMKDPQVFVVRNNRAYKISVQTGQIDAEYVEIIEGISADDVIVITGQINLKDGSEVSVLN